MAKYAVVVSATRGYMPGLNAFLNAMEFYGCVVPTYVLTWEDLPGEYTSQFKVEFVPIKQTDNRDPIWWIVLSPAMFTVDKLKDYDVVLIWGSDVCLVHNIVPFFDIADKTGMMILGTNEHGTHGFHQMSTAWPYEHTWNVPFADIPCFVPRSRFDVLEKVLEYQNSPGARVDWMDSLNYAVRDLKTPVLPVAGERWVQNVPYRMPLQWDGKHIYFKDSSTRLYSFHRKYWNNNICKTYLQECGPIGQANKLLFNRIYNFFNRECRVKWTESLEVWDGQ